MFKVLLIVILVLPFGLLVADTYKIYSSETGREISLPKLAKSLQNYDVIFFGEFHDNSIHHEMEIKLLKLLYKRNKSIALSLEMFERDVQNSLNQYLNDTLTEEEFLGVSRPWPNYKADYQPMVEFAKKNSLPVIAANVPRRYAAGVNAEGISYLETIPEAEKQFVAKEIKVLNDAYREKFIKTMNVNMGSAMHSKATMNFDNLYAAQCLKDDTMAESIAEFLTTHPGTHIYHVNGDFHSSQHLGTAQKLKLLKPELKIAVISPVGVKDPDKKPRPEWDYEAGDFIVIIPITE
ncbi:MAG: ChaN family lipoprotein [Candidatus Cloacimonetes bacterium]|nr:ChaN family lipoprotein [Candidatus Cloacimonadota bacterium]